MRALLVLFLLAGLCTATIAQEPPADPGPDAVPEPPPCGTEPISIARMQWPSAAILAYVHADILKSQLGCDVQVVAGDLSATTSSMATTGRPLVAPEVWLSRVVAIWNSALETGRIRQAAPSFTGGAREAWFVPDYVQEDNPALKSAADLKDHWQVFAGKAQRAQFVSCPADWACSVINRNLIRAYGLDTRFDVVEPDNRFALDKRLGEAVSRHEPVLFYYWQPNGVLDQLHFKPLDMGSYDARAMACLAETECTDPTPSAFPNEQVVIAISDDLFTLSPTLVSYFQRASMPLAEMNALLAHLSESGGTPADAAQVFVKTRPDIWQHWLGR